MARIVLGQKNSFLLLKYMEAEYVKSGLNDADYAVKASEVLLFDPPSNKEHVGHARRTLELPSNSLESTKQTLIELRVKELEDLVLSYTTRLDDCIRKVETLQRDLHLHPAGVRK